MPKLIFRSLDRQPAPLTHRYREFAPCPQSGAGVHGWILGTANQCRAQGLPASDAVAIIAGQLTRRPTPANEVQTAVAKAYGEPGHCIRPQYKNSPVPISEVAFDPARLKATADRIVAPRNWRHWLYERSPKRPDAMGSKAFLAHLYEPGETVLTFDKLDAKKPLETVRINRPMDCRMDPRIVAGGLNGQGVWFLSNPVDGAWHESPSGQSCRSEAAVTAFRYAVLESDQAPAQVWLAFIAQLPARVAAIYTSGGRSIHTLIRVDATSKAAWDAAIQPLKRPLRVLGGDSACLSGVRLTRLPGCWRPGKGFQKLLYLCPNPPTAPLMDLPALRTRGEMLTRWRTICPRWNPKLKAFE